MNNLSLNPFTFPFWWYSAGAAIVWKWAKQNARYGLWQTGLPLFSRHMGEPLFGDYSKSGRVVGFFLRTALLFFKLLAFLVRLMLIAIALTVYAALLPFVVGVIIYLLIPS